MDRTLAAIPRWQERTAILFGEKALARLSDSRVLLVGVGGVGGHAGEALVRSGVGHLALADFDTVDITNCNRQLAALHSTAGRSKLDVLKERFLDINPELDLTLFPEKVTPENVSGLLNGPWDFLLDAIDTVDCKCALLLEARRRRIPTVSAMGAGGKTDPAQVRIADIGNSCQCPLARQVRGALRKQGVTDGILTVFSTEPTQPGAVRPPDREAGERRPVVGTVSYMPAVFGLYMASAAIRTILGKMPDFA